MRFPVKCQYRYTSSNAGATQSSQLSILSWRCFVGMGLVRFWAFWSRSASSGDKFLEVFGDFAEQFSGHAGGHAKHASEHVRQAAAQVTERHRPIDPPRRVRLNQLLSGQISGQGIEVVTDHLRPDILARGQPSQAGSMLQTQAMLEALESLFDAPAPVIKVGECRRRIVRGVEQGSHEHADLSRRCHLADQTHG